MSSEDTTDNYVEDPAEHAALVAEFNARFGDASPPPPPVYSITSLDLALYFGVDDGLTTYAEWNNDDESDVELTWKDDDDRGYYRLEYVGEPETPTTYRLRWRFAAELCDAPERVLTSDLFKHPTETWTTIEGINTSSPFALASCGWEDD